MVFECKTMRIDFLKPKQKNQEIKPVWVSFRAAIRKLSNGKGGGNKGEMG